MLHTRSEEGVTRKFAEGTRIVLKGLANMLRDAKRGEEADKADRAEVKGTLISLSGVREFPGSFAYQLDDAGKASEVLCLDLGVHYEPDEAKLAKVLGDRLELVLTRKPKFDAKKAEAAIKTGAITEAELARCVTAVARPSAVLREAGGATTPKGIKPGEGRLNPLILAKGLKLHWGKEG